MAARELTDVATQPTGVVGLTAEEAARRLARTAQGLGPVAEVLDHRGPSLVGFAMALLAAPAVFAVDAIDKRRFGPAATDPANARSLAMMA